MFSIVTMVREKKSSKTCGRRKGNQASLVGKITGYRQEHRLSVEGGTHRQRVAKTVLSETCCGLLPLQKGGQSTTLIIHPPSTARVKYVERYLHPLCSLVMLCFGTGST